MCHVIYPTMCLFRVNISHRFKCRIEEKKEKKNCIILMLHWIILLVYFVSTTVMMTTLQTRKVLRQERYECHLTLVPNMMYGNTTCKMSRNFYYENIFVECIMTIQPNIQTKDPCKFNVDK